MQCNLYGHANVEPASGLKGNCYSLSGAQVIEPVEAVKEGKKVIIDDGSLEKLPSKDEDFELVGNGICRGKVRFSFASISCLICAKKFKQLLWHEAIRNEFYTSFMVLNIGAW